jgi:putative membrane protein
MIILIGIIHGGFAIGEIFFGKILLEVRLGFPPEVAAQANPIVQNAGIYNSFIAAGLLWSAFSMNNSKALRMFFLICVVIAGIFGAITLKKPTTLYIQTIPAIIAIILVWMIQDDPQ